MACNPETLRKVPLFALLDDDEIAVLASQVELQAFAPRQRIYKAGEAGGRGYIVVSGAVRVTTVDADQQEVVVESTSILNLIRPASPKATTREAWAAADGRPSTKKCNSHSSTTRALSRASMNVKIGRPAMAAKAISQSQAASLLHVK